MTAKTVSPAKGAAKDKSRQFDAVYAGLCRILRRHEGKLSVVEEKPGTLWMNVAGAVFRGRPLSFGGVRIGKNYVSYYLMPVYMCKAVPPELKKRMQGKACFNFTEVDEKLFGELDKLTAKVLVDFTPDKLEQMFGPQKITGTHSR